MYLFTAGLSNLVGKHPGDRNPSSPGEILSEHLLCEWRLHESPLKLRWSAMLLKAGRAKATQNTKPIHLERTWGIEAIRVILGGIGCKDVHSRVVCSTDGIGVDPGDHHVPIYEPVPAKEKPEVIHPQGYKQGFHNMPSKDISCSAILPSVHPRDATRFRQLSYGKAKNNSRGTVKGTSKADEDKVIFLELYKKCLKKSIHERKKNSFQIKSMVSSQASLNKQRDAQVTEWPLDDVRPTLARHYLPICQKIQKMTASHQTELGGSSFQSTNGKPALFPNPSSSFLASPFPVIPSRQTS